MNGCLILRHILYEDRKLVPRHDELFGYDELLFCDTERYTNALVSRYTRHWRHNPDHNVPAKWGNSVVDLQCFWVTRREPLKDRAGMTGGLSYNTELVYCLFSRCKTT